MSEPGHEPETGRETQGPETLRIPVRPAPSAEGLPASPEAGSLLPSGGPETAESAADPYQGGAYPPGPEPGPATEEADGGTLHRWRLAFRGWRRTRPFWGGLLVTLGGGEILLTYRASFGVVLHFGLYGLAGYFVPGLLVVLGLLIIFDPPHRTFYSVLAVLAALGTWLTSNLGGFVIGMLLGLVGGSLAFGWQQGARPARKRRRVRARATG